MIVSCFTSEWCKRYANSHNIFVLKDELLLSSDIQHGKTSELGHGVRGMVPQT